MENKYLVDEIRNILKETVYPCYENTARTEIYCRCPECGDSTHNKLSAHLYISMEPPFKFYCQKCGFHGVLNQDLLNRLNVYNNNLELNILEANKTVKNNVNFKYTESKKALSDYKDSDDDEIAILSQTYINNRFNTQLSLDELNTKFKCICNPYKFLSEQDSEFTKRKSRFDFSKSIGFLSSDNKYLICRDSSGKQELRYSNTSLSNDPNKSKIYNIRTPINILQDKIKLVITEGIFDAIGIYLKEYQDAENTIVAAACGKSFIQVIDKFIKMGFLNLEIHIYSDTDVDISFYKTMKKKSPYISDDKIYVYYNTLGKDCGVSTDQIETKCIEVV